MKCAAAYLSLALVILVLASPVTAEKRAITFDDLIAMSPLSAQLEAPLELGRRWRRVEDWLATLNLLGVKDSRASDLLAQCQKHMSSLDKLYLQLLVCYEVDEIHWSSPTGNSISTFSGPDAGSELWDLPTTPNSHGMRATQNSPEKASRKPTE